ncbi:MAG: DUF4012 domain-containing protein [Acidimicrobiales bacterium]
MLLGGFGLAALVVLIGVVGVIGVLHALRLERQLNGVTTALRSTQSDVENGKLQAARDDLGRAETTLTRVNSALYTSPDFELLNLLPVARQNLDAVRSTVGLGLQLVGDGQDLLNQVSPLKSPSGHLDVPIQGGQIPLSVLKPLQSTLSDVLTQLPASAAPPGGPLVLGQVQRAQARIYAEAVRRRSELTSVSEGLSLVDDLAGANGDQRYLIAVANSAEMRGSGGMILSYGVLTSHAGKVTLSQFGPISQLALGQPETAVPFPADFTHTYQGLGPTQHWREANLMSDFTVDAPVLGAMYTKATGLPVNGVIQIDPAGLGAILAGVGPVTTQDLGQVTAANVVPLTLNQAYLLFPNRPVRQDYTEQVAKAAFAQLTSGNFPSLRPLGTALVQAGKQRHVMMWASDPAEESTIAALGFAGALPGPGVDFTQLTVQNVGGDKMDYYLQSALEIAGKRPGKAGAAVTITVTLHDTAPPDQHNVAIFGPGTDPLDPPGVYRGLVTVYLPHFSYLSRSRVGATSTAPQSGTQNGVTAISWTVDIPPGGSSTTVLHVYLPPRPAGPEHFVFVPSPRVIPTTYVDHLT